MYCVRLRLQGEDMLLGPCQEQEQVEALGQDGGATDISTVPRHWAKCLSLDVGKRGLLVHGTREQHIAQATFWLVLLVLSKQSQIFLGVGSWGFPQQKPSAVIPISFQVRLQSLADANADLGRQLQQAKEESQAAQALWPAGVCGCGFW